MPSARLVIVGGPALRRWLEEQDLDGMQSPLQLGDRVDQVRQIMALAHVDAERDRRICCIERDARSAKVGISVSSAGCSTQKKSHVSKHLIA